MSVSMGSAVHATDQKAQIALSLLQQMVRGIERHLTAIESQEIVNSAWDMARCFLSKAGKEEEALRLRLVQEAEQAEKAARIRSMAARDQL